MGQVLAELKRIYEDPSGRLTEDDVCGWTDLAGLAATELYDAIAVYLARGFHDGALKYEFCNAVANDLFALIVSIHNGLPEMLFFDVYDAFDEGEHDHFGRSKDPVEEFTKPMIARIVEGLR